MMDIWHATQSLKHPIKRNWTKARRALEQQQGWVLLYSEILDDDSDELLEELITLHGSLMTLLSESVQ